MKLLILGGAGDMGSYIVKDAIKYGDMWTDITIADIKKKSAEKMISELGDPRMNFIGVDANNHEELVNLMKDYNVVCSAIGPFYHFGVKVVSAAIEAKVPLVDICDDPDPTKEILEMDELAKKANIPIYLGYGWTPGLTNLLAKHAYDKLDRGQPVRFNISWAGGAADADGFAVVLHFLYAITGDFPSYQDGKFVDIPSGKGNAKIDYPAPLKIVNVADCGHPEPVTIPRFLPDVKECTLKGGLTPDWNNKYAEFMKQLHLIQGKTRRKIMGKFTYSTEKLLETGGVDASSARVDVYGTYQGKSVHWVYCTPSLAMGELTGYPASITAQLFAQDKIGGVGILPPEALPKNTSFLFFEELKKRGIEMFFDEKEPLEKFKPPEPFSPGLIYRYGFAAVVFFVLSILVLGILWIISTIL